MTTKRDSKTKPNKDERPKLKKEKLKDLQSRDEVRGGRVPHTCIPDTSCGQGCSL